jgi:excisionase family DNA binding protein
MPTLPHRDDVRERAQGVEADSLRAPLNHVVLTPPAAAALLGVSCATVHRSIAGNQLRVLRVGGSRMLIPLRRLMRCSTPGGSVRFFVYRWSSGH